MAVKGIEHPFGFVDSIEVTSHTEQPSRRRDTSKVTASIGFSRAKLRQSGLNVKHLTPTWLVSEGVGLHGGDPPGDRLPGGLRDGEVIHPDSSSGCSW
jgi:hypothetical protein